MLKMRLLSFLSLILILGAASCERTAEENDNFNRSKMLENYANNLIKPNFTDLQNSVTTLKTSISNFTQTPNETNLVSLQNEWLAAYKAWQYCNAFNFGPAGALGLTRALSEEIATFPVSETKIATAIAAPNFNDFNRDSRGFLAIEYLIFDGTNSEIVNLFNDTKRKEYLNALINHIETKVNNVVNSWNGTYYNDFVKNNGTDVGSSVSQMYNEFVRSFETIKNVKIELPFGKRPGQTQTEPHLVEAFYSGKSTEILAEHLKAIENIYFGKNKQGVQNGLSFKDYVNSVEGGKSLVSDTEAQWILVKEKFNAISRDNTLAYLIDNDAETIENFRLELQKHTRYFKSDMSSVLGIAITYSSGDGD
ncbi:MAG: hypothetical protein RLZZ414_584 [Bacteroidota bacterium]|jgi:predicted lipoprotein